MEATDYGNPLHPLTDGSELVSVTTDLTQNMDKLDLAAGFQAVTSSTRPSSPYSGKGIFETDTSYRSFFSNGSAPASASWVEVPNSSGTFGGDLKLASTKQLNIGASASTASIAAVNAATSSDLLSSRITGDTQSRFVADADGALFWGAGGAAATDTTLYRSAADTLRTGDNLVVDLALTVTGNINSAANFNTAAWTTYTPTWTSSGTAPALGNGVLVGRYQRIGRTIVVHINLIPGSTTTYGTGNYSFALPAQAANAGCTYIGNAHMIGTDRWAGQFLVSPNLTVGGPSFPISTTNTRHSLMSPTLPETFANGTQLRMTAMYEAAS